MNKNDSKLPEPDLVDQIADALPADLRAPYYRVMRHCRSLSENDELLQILRVMQFLTLLMEQVPNRVIVERQKLDQLFAQGLQVIQKTFEANKTYHQQLDRRLTQLPESIARGISPEAIAGAINESLRQQFIRSTIPQSAEALARISQDMETVVTDFSRTAGRLGEAYGGAAADARRAIDELQSTMSRAAAAARAASKDLSITLHKEVCWILYGLSGLALLVGLGLGMLIHGWLNPPHKYEFDDPLRLIQPAPDISPPGPPPKTKR